jgi:hypothetical protein
MRAWLIAPFRQQRHPGKGADDNARQHRRQYGHHQHGIGCATTDARHPMGQRVANQQSRQCGEQTNPERGPDHLEIIGVAENPPVVFGREIDICLHDRIAGQQADHGHQPHRQEEEQREQQRARRDQPGNRRDARTNRVHLAVALCRGAPSSSATHIGSSKSRPRSTAIARRACQSFARSSVEVRWLG